MRDETSGEVTFEEFADHEFNAVVALALASLHDEDDALDIAQETMTRALQQWSDVGGMDRPGAWTRRVALNLITDLRRARTRRHRLATRLSARPAPLDPTADLWDERLWAEVAALPRRRREVVMLFYVLDLSVDAIAETLETATGTVKSDLARARNELRRRMEDDDE